ncbi:MAG: ABC transporter ATP-binding protein [Verrucomicrobiota bacterium]
MSDGGEGEPRIALSFEGVSRHFPKSSAPALDGVDLSIIDGEVLSLIGSSGSGKTTLLRIAAGLDWPDSGRVCIDGECVSDGENANTRVPPERRRLGLVSQEGALFPHLSVERNISYGLHRLGRGEARKRIHDCLYLVDLKGKEDRFPHELSGGERQRLALARALAPQPRILLFDEPFSHLDPPLRRSLREEIRRILIDLKQTALLVTHDPEDALAISQRIAVMGEGRLLQIGEPDEVYRFPVSRYCAERFGPVNATVDATSGETVWKRPEEARWLDTDSVAEGTPVTVESVAPLGQLWEVRVRLDEAIPESSWLCLLGGGEIPCPGDRGKIAWDEKAETGSRIRK